MSPAICDNFTTSLLIWMPFISFYFLTAMARTSNNMLNISSKNEYPCLILDFRGKAFSFLPLSMMLPVDLSQWP